MNIKLESTQAVTATLVPDNERMNFLPEAFGRRLFLEAEMAVYNWLGRLSSTYRGGYWEFYRLSNGGIYMAPRSQAPFAVAVEGNGYAGEMTADAAGIVATLFTLSHLLFQPLGDADLERLSRVFDALREFAKQHAEARKILAAID